MDNLGFFSFLLFFSITVNRTKHIELNLLGFKVRPSEYKKA